MTDRINGLIVVLEHDIREDDALATVDAIRQLRGVLSVTANISDIDSHIAYERALSDLRQRLWEALKSR